MRRISLFEVLYDSQRMNFVVEATIMALERPIESTLSSVPKRRMSDVVNQSQRLGQVFMQAKRSRCRTSITAATAQSSSVAALPP